MERDSDCGPRDATDSRKATVPKGDIYGSIGTAAHFNREGPTSVGPDSLEERFTARLEVVPSRLYDQRSESAAKNISIAFLKAGPS
jgi:hypothetical protein